MAHNVIDRPELSTINATAASQFDEVAELLEAQGADSFRVAAYRRGAESLRQMHDSVERVYRDQGIPGLVDLPGIGYALARGIAEIVDIGEWRWLDHLRGELDPERVFCTVAGIGPTLAHRAHEHLGINHLEELEAAAHDGRLAKVPGFGAARVRAVMESLAGRLGHRSHARLPDRPEPRVSTLLDIDDEYRRRVEADDLPRITPARFNPRHRKWLPVLHTRREDHTYTAMFSNTARAHQLGRTRDWVVIYNDDPHDRQWTAVTERSGPAQGRRVIRGRELKYHRI